MTHPPADLDIEVRGGATAEEIAAVVEVLLVGRSRGAEGPDRYARWRRDRLTALRADPAEDG